MNENNIPKRTLAFAEMQVVARAEYLDDKRKWYFGTCPDEYNNETWEKIQIHYRVIEIDQIANLRYFEHLVEYINSEYHDNVGTGWELYLRTIGNELIQVTQKIDDLENSITHLMDGTYKTVSVAFNEGFKQQKDLEAGHAVASRYEDVFKFERYREELLLMKKEMKAYIEYRESTIKGNAKVIRNWN